MIMSLLHIFNNTWGDKLLFEWAILKPCGIIRWPMLALMSISLVNIYHLYLIYITHNYIIQLHEII